MSLHRDNSDLLKEVEKLRATNRILEEENLQLSERAEDAMLLAQVAEALAGVSDPEQVIERVLERISILKDLPCVTCGRLQGTMLECVSSYASFTESDNIGYPLALSSELLSELRHGPFLTDYGEGLTATFNEDSFTSGPILLVPFSCHLYGAGVFLFFDRQGGRGRLANMLFLLEQVVHLTVSRLDNLFLGQQLEQLNLRLEERVRQKTRDLMETNVRLQQTYDRFVAILNGVDAYINVIDTRDYTVLFANRAAKKRFGSDVEGQPCYQAVRGNSLPCSDCKVPELIAGGGDRPFVTWESYNAKHDEWFLLNEHILDWPDVPQALLSVGTEITTLKKAEEEKRLLAEKLHQAQKIEAIGVLAGSVAHDLNNILSGVVSYPELLLATMELEPGVKKGLETIQSAGRKAARIVQDLLTLSRRGVRDMEIVELRELITDFLDGPECSEMLTLHPGVTLLGPGAGTDLFVSGSSAHLANVFMNLINNGAEAIDGEGTVSIGMEEVNLTEQPVGFESWRSGRYASITVTDTGSGIPDSVQERIFDPFFSLNKKGRSGTGLGLAVVWGTVHDHMGSIDVQSSEGEGTRFQIYLPLVESLDGGSSHKQENTLVFGNKEVVMVVDDESEQRRIAEEILTYLGYSPICAGSGEEALGVVENTPVEIVLLDMLMGEGMDGLQTYREIRKVRPEQKTIIVSGFSQSDRVNEAISLGVARYLQKPYTLSGISEVIAETLQKISPTEGEDK